jgi:predicted nucleic acid-binding protein
VPTVSNTSPISNLACIGRLDLLRQQFAEIWIPEAVETELGNIPDETVRKAIEAAKEAAWLKARKVSNVKLVDLLAMQQ